MSVSDTTAATAREIAVPSGRIATAVARVRALALDASHEGIARRTALFAFAIRVASAAIAYVAQIVLARWMGTHDYGIYVFVWTWVLVLGNLSGLGFGMASMRFVPEHVERGETEALRGYLLGSRLSGFLAGSVFAAAGIAIVLALGDAVASPYVWPLILAFVCLPFFALTETQDGIARSLDSPGTALLPPYIVRPLLILVFMVGSHEWGVPSTATVAMICAIAATWIAGLIQLVALERRIGARVTPGPRRMKLRYWFAASLPLFVADGMHVLLMNIDVIILTGFVAPDQVGIYYAVTKTLVLGSFVAFAVGAAVAHRYAEYHVAGDRTKLQAFVTKSAAWTFWPTLAAVGLMLLLGRPFLALFGPGFVEGYHLMLVLSIGILARAAIGPTDRLLAVLGQQGAFARIVVATLLVAIGLHLMLVPVYGALGSAAAVALATMFEAAALAFVAKARCGLSVGIWHRLPRSAS